MTRNDTPDYWPNLGGFILVIINYYNGSDLPSTLGTEKTKTKKTATLMDCVCEGVHEKCCNHTWCDCANYFFC